MLLLQYTFFCATITFANGNDFAIILFLGAAVGFRLDSLLKLTETRARNNKMTLMHYLCKVHMDTGKLSLF